MQLNIVHPAPLIHAPRPALKPAVDPATLSHKHLLAGEFWRKIPAYADIDESTFLDHGWQARNSITRVERLIETLQGIASQEFLYDATLGFNCSPMSVRLSPYLVSLIDWTRPYEDPLRRQFIPVQSRVLPDHPRVGLDSLNEQGDAPVPGLTHRYADKALFVALDKCPVYCRFCTRSYAVGIDTDEIEKVNLPVNAQRWRDAFAYIASRPEIEDVVVSGGDAYQLRAAQITEIGDALLAMPHVRRIRFATKGLAVMPQKIVTDDAWREALVAVVKKGRKLHKDVVIHTHFNHPNEITWITERATGLLMESGVTVRNQSVLIRGVNDSVETMTRLVKRLSHVNIHPYYVYLHDLVKGVEDLRTTLDTALHLEKNVRGSTAGFNTPTFVIDAPGGGGKRDVHSFEYYDRETGISVFTSPAVRKDALYLYFDPLHALAPSVQRRWEDPIEQEAMTNAAIARVRRTERPFSRGVRGGGSKPSFTVEEKAWP